MTSQAPKILIFGSTGFIGKHIATAIFNASSQFAKTGIFTSQASAERKADELTAFRAKGAAIIIGDIENEQDVREAYEGYDTVVSALGRDAIPKQIALIHLAERSKTIQRFFPSESGTDVEYSTASTTEPVH